MRLLDRYLLRELLVPLFYCLVGFQIFWLAFDLVGNLQQYQDRGLGWQTIGEITLLRVPNFLNTVLPIALLLALLYTLTNLVRHNELVAMRSAGVSLARICLPFFVLALLLGGGVFVANEYVFPNALGKADRMYTTGQADANQWLETPENFHIDTRNQTWRIKRYNPATLELEGTHVEWKKGNLEYVMHADRTIWIRGIWESTGVHLEITDSAKDPLPSRNFRTNTFTDPIAGVTPAEVLLEIKIAQLKKTEAAKNLTLSLADIIEYRRMHKSLSREKAALVMTQFHGRIAQPFTCLVVVLVALPFGATSGRRNLFAGVAGSVGICFAYFILQRVGLALGTGEYIHPILAAWLPNLVFAATGLGLLWLQETRTLELGRWLPVTGKSAPSEAS